MLIRPNVYGEEIRANLGFYNFKFFLGEVESKYNLYS